MTFGGQLVHIAQANGFFVSKIAGTPSPIGKPDKMDKASVVKLVGDSYDYVIKSIGSLTPEQFHAELELEGMKMNGLDALMLAADHTTHHRAQCIVYLRVKGIKPADYRASSVAAVVTRGDRSSTPSRRAPCRHRCS